MLVLSRKSNQEIMIGDDIQITVLQVKGNTIRIGIQAPSNVRIMRGEIVGKESEKLKRSPTSISDQHSKIAPADERNLPKFKVETSGMTVRFGKTTSESDGRVEFGKKENPESQVTIAETRNEFLSESN